LSSHQLHRRQQWQLEVCLPGRSFNRIHDLSPPRYESLDCSITYPNNHTWRSHIDAHSYVHLYIDTHSFSYSNRYTDTHFHTYQHANAHEYSHEYADTHTHTHTRTRYLSLLRWL